MKNYQRLLIAAAAAASMSAGAQEFTMSDFVLSGSRAAGIAATKPAADGRYYYMLSGDGSTIEKYDYKNGKLVGTPLSTDKLEGCDVAGWTGYAFSPTENKVLLWTDSHPIYRHSFSADYWVFDVKSGKIDKLTPEGGEEIATFSPDGNRVAFVKDNNVMVKNLATGMVTAVTTDGVKNKVINGVPDWVYQEEFGILNSLEWSPDGATLAFIRWDESQVPMYKMTMYEGNCATQPQNSLYPGSYDYKYPVAGEPNSVVSVLAWDVATGKLSTVALPTDSDTYVPHLAFAATPENGGKAPLMVTTLNRLQNDLNIYSVDLQANVATAVFNDKSDTWIDSEMARQVTYYDNFFIIPSERSGYCQLYFVTLDGKQVIQFTQGNEDVKNYYGFDEKRQRFYYQTTAGPLNRQVKYVDQTGEHHALTGSDGTYGVTFGGNFDYYIQSWSDARTPTQYTIWDTSKGKKVRDLEMNADYAKKYTGPAVPKREFFTVAGAAGDQLNGFMIKPAGFDPARKYPIIMTQYSGPGSQSVKNQWMLDWQEWFAMQGYVIVCVDGRGTGGRGKAFTSSVYLKLGQLETQDQVAAAKWVASQPWADAQHIGIWGWSYGGYEALSAMSWPGNPYAAGVAIAPVTHWKWYDTIYAERYMRTPQLNPEGYEQGAPIANAKQLTTQPLIIFGSADDNVHIINAMQYIAELQGNGNDFDMMVYTNKNHSINGCDIREHLYRKVMQYFDAKLKTQK